MATLRELQTIYGYGDVLDMVDVVQTDHYNEDVAYKDAAKQRK